MTGPCRLLRNSRHAFRIVGNGSDYQVKRLGRPCSLFRVPDN
jgi:hypothetical protein